MRPPEDRDRGQSVWVGAVLLLALLAIVYTTYQVTVVPRQNAGVEFDHARETGEAMRHLRDRIYLARAAGGTQSLTVDLGPDYPPRLVAINPPPPTGRIRTVAPGAIAMTADGSPVDLSAVCGYGTGPTLRSRALAVHVEYNEYRAAPTVVYSQTALYRRVDGEYLLDDGQSLVRNATITLSPLTTPYSVASTGAVSVQVTAGSVGQTSVTADDALELTIPTPLPAAEWATLLSDQSTVRGVGQAGEDRVAITLAPGTYTVACAPVGIEAAPPGGVRSIGQGETTKTPTETPRRGWSGNRTPSRPG